MKASLLLIAAVVCAAAPTFNQDVAPILYENCATCHRAGEVAPFPLLTYQDAAKRAPLIALATEKRFMPPWKPEPGFGSFAHERRLTDQQIQTLKEWAAAGAPEGSGKAPAVPSFPQGWQLGEPDRVFKMPMSFEVPADGPDQFECFVIPTGFAEDVYVGTAEFRPGNARVVHHALVMLDTTGRARELAKENGGTHYPCFGGTRTGVSGLFFGWAPGSVAPPAEPGISRKIEKGTDLVVQLHYHPSGKVEKDQSTMGIHFAPPPTKGIATVLMLNTNIYIPAGVPEHRVKASVTMPRDGELFAIAPHAHYLGKEMKVTANLPDGSVTPLIYIKDWDFNWQGQYRFKEPIKLPGGTRIDLDFTYDNSTANPQNPSNPPKMVRWGEQTTDEMAVVFMGVMLPKPDDVPAFQANMQRQMLQTILSGLQSFDDLPPEIPPSMADGLKRALVLFDRNKNGKLDPEESVGLMRLLDTLSARPQQAQ
jgi:hypothetical protein